MVNVKPVAWTGAVVAVGAVVGDGVAAAVVKVAAGATRLVCDWALVRAAAGADNERASTPVASPLTQKSTSTTAIPQPFNVPPVDAFRLTVYPSRHSSPRARWPPPNVAQPYRSRTQRRVRLLVVREPHFRVVHHQRRGIEDAGLRGQLRRAPAHRRQPPEAGVPQ